MSQYDNPFASPVASNPFSDPSVQATQGPPTDQRPGASSADFNPFEARGSQQQQPQAQQPAILNNQAPPPPPYASSAQQRISSEELDRRQRELEARSRELERREEEQRAAAGGGGQRANNWPPMPSFCPVGPCFYQDFDLEIPASNRSIVKTGYYLWIAHVVLLLVNIFGALAYFIVVNASDAVVSGTVFGMSLLVCIVLPPCSYVCWFRPLYKAFKNDSSFNFFFFFLIFFVQVCILVVQCLGLNYLGSCGWINASATMKVNIGAGVFMMIIAACFTLLVVADILVFIRVHRIYRSTGASFAKARQEFGQGVATNETVRGAAAGAAASTFSAVVSGGGGNGGSGGRY